MVLADREAVPPAASAVASAPVAGRAAATCSVLVEDQGVAGTCSVPVGDREAAARSALVAAVNDLAEVAGKRAGAAPLEASIGVDR